MSDQEHTQLYLVTPSEFEPAEFSLILVDLLDEFDIACVRVALGTRDETRIIKCADSVREICHARDVAVVIQDHVLMVERLGLDGVHFSDGSRHVRKTRKDLGDDAIVGTFCGASRHDGMSAGEQGADYVSLGPISGANLGDGTLAEFDTFQWWSEMIEVPIIAEGGLTPELITKLTPVSDFFAIGDEIWTQDDPKAALSTLIAAMG